MKKLGNQLFILVFFLFGIVQSDCLSQSEANLYVIDPLETWWDTDPGTIASAQFTFRPQGVYMEVGMYLKFSAKGSSLESNEDVLETSLEFRLPEGSLVTDSWLWIGDEIIQAAVEERWEAERIYNEIVGRRVDPSILTKYDDFYLLNVYPLEPDSTRRVKINYLTPLQWSSGKASIPVPVDILASSNLPIEDLSFIYFPKESFSNPNFVGLERNNFIDIHHAEFGRTKVLDIDHSKLPKELNLEVDVKMNNGVFISNYKDENKEYYQIAMLPHEAFDIEIPSKHILFVLDYDTNRTSLEQSDLLGILKSQIEDQLDDNDFFNIMLPYTDLIALSGNWIKSTQENVNNTFNLLEENFNEFVGQENFTELLFSTKDLIESENSTTDIIVLSLNEEIENTRKADELLDQVKEFISPEKVRMHFIHYQDKFSNYEWNYFYDNKDYVEYWKSELPNYYFYENLAEYTNATNQYLFDFNNLEQLISRSIHSISNLTGKPKISNLIDGNCFDQYDVFQEVSQFNTSTIVKVGRCKGGQLTLNLSAETQDGDQIQSIHLDSGHVNPGNEVTKISYFGNFILSLERLYNPYLWLTTQGIETIIDFSKRFRVLSNYTAFLALEKEIGGFVCEHCVDETDPNDKTPESIGGRINDGSNDVDLNNMIFDGGNRGSDLEPKEGDEVVTSTTELELLIKSNIKAIPNPFSNSIEITIKNIGLKNLNHFELSILDINGRLIKKFSKDEIRRRGEDLIVNWNGNHTNGSQVHNGIYVVTFNTPGLKSSLKLVKV